MGKLRLKVVRHSFFERVYKESHRPYRKGIRLIFLNQDADIGAFAMERVLRLFLWFGSDSSLFRKVIVFYCGNANEFGDASGSPGKSYLFFLTI